MIAKKQRISSKINGKIIDKTEEILQYLHLLPVLYSNMDISINLSALMPAQRKNSITEVVNGYSHRLLAFIRNRVGNDADAEDILQDVFYQFMGYSQPIEKLTSWLFRVAQNRIIDTQRKKKPDSFDILPPQSGEEGIQDWKEMLFDAGNDPETAYLRSLFWEELQRSLDNLPAEQRDVFILNELEGVSFKAISEKTGLPISTLLSRKRYAVVYLRKRLSVLRKELLDY